MNKQKIAEESYQKLYQGMTGKDTQQLKRLLAADFRLVHMTGVRQTKREWLQAIETEQIHYFSARKEAVRIQESGQSLLVIGQIVVAAEIYGSRHIWRLQVTLTLQPVADRWLISKAVASTYQGRYAEVK